MPPALQFLQLFEMDMIPGPFPPGVQDTYPERPRRTGIDPIDDPERFLATQGSMDSAHRNMRDIDATAEEWMGPGAEVPVSEPDGPFVRPGPFSRGRQTPNIPPGSQDGFDWGDDNS